MAARILLVDDEPINHRLYQVMLKNCNYTFNTASNGQECLVKARDWDPDIILMDWNMPVMDGLEALEYLKKDSQTADMPVLIATGVMTTTEDLSKALNLGAVDFLKKPFDKLELIARLRNILLLSESMKALRVRNQELEANNSFIISLLESIPHPVAYYATDGTLVRFNHCFETLVGVDRRKLIGQSVYRYSSSELLKHHLKIDEEILECRETKTYEVMRSGDKKTFIISKNAVVDADDSVSGIIAMFTDISELKKANEEVITNKKVELISSTLKLMHLSESHSNLLDEMNDLVLLVGEKEQNQIKQLQSRYKVNLAKDVLIDFETRLEGAFDSFLQLLVEKYPYLTSNDRKLCALLRSGLSSKEIAVLTFQNPQSVDVARYRLRKKLNLSSEDNLTDFLLLIDK